MFKSKNESDVPENNSVNVESEPSEKTNVKDSSKSKSTKVDPILHVLKRNKEIEKRTMKALGTNVVLGLVCLASIGANVYIGTRPPPQPRYIVQQSDGSFLPIIPLSKPIANKNAVTQVATDAVLALHALDFKNYRTQLNEAATYFTKKGFPRYMKELEATGTLAAIQSRQLILSATVTKVPVITREYDINGIYAWDVEVPYAVSYFGAGFSQEQNMVAKITMIRIPTTENPRGIAITGFNSRR